MVFKMQTFIFGLLMSMSFRGIMCQPKYTSIKEVIDVSDIDLATDCKERIQMINPTDGNLILSGPGNFTKIQPEFTVEVAFKVFGTCCWEVYSKNFFRGKRTEILPGTIGQVANLGSLRTLPCRTILGPQ